VGLGGWAEVFRCVESCSGWRADLELRASRMSYVSPGWLDGAIDIETAREACHASMPAEKLWLGVPDIDSSGVVVDLIQHYPECLCLTTMTSALYKHPPRYDSP